jgi:predicted RNase H-like nuclease (RuvC/YqgF family)
MTELSKDQTIARLAEENDRLYREVTELRGDVARLEAEADELAGCIPASDIYRVDL